MNLSYSTSSRFRIEAQARKMGMVYPSEIKVINPNNEE